MIPSRLRESTIDDRASDLAPQATGASNKVE
jgi:hypothetical protein